MITELLENLVSAHDLPDPPPADPMPLLADWYVDAKHCGKYDDFNTIALATATPDGVPSVRIVLCKSIEPARPALTFFTNYQSRKGRELADNPRASAVFHWPHAKRQARVEGTIERMTAAESDEYFRSRPLVSRIGACVSRQSEPIESRSKIISAAMALAGSVALGAELSRPDYWGGFRLIINTVELWSAREGRLHQRVAWQRTSAGPPLAWKHALLSP